MGMAKVIPEFGSGNPMRILLFIFCAFYFRFGAGLLRYMSWFTVWKKIFFPSFSTLKATKSLSASEFNHSLYLAIMLTRKQNVLVFIL